MHTNAAGSVSSLIAAVRALGERFLTLATLEGQEAGLNLLWMLGLVQAAAMFVVTAWLSILAGIVLALVRHGAVALGCLLLGHGGSRGSIEPGNPCGCPVSGHTEQTRWPASTKLRGASRVACRAHAFISGTRC